MITIITIFHTVTKQLHEKKKYSKCDKVKIKRKKKLNEENLNGKKYMIYFMFTTIVLQLKD